MTRGAVTVSYNGELWNTAMLRGDLMRLGYQFTTTSDTEVVASALDCWGSDALTRFDGQFAMAWGSMTDQRLFLARDRFGEIPLHVCYSHGGLYDGGYIVAASERRAFAAMGLDGAVTDVMPGTWQAYHPDGRMTSEQWYDAPTAQAALVGDEATRLRELLKAASRRRLIGDVPTCVLLSGGIDSAVIAACVQPDVTIAYTAVFNTKSQDLRRARLTAQAFNMDLIEVPITVPTPEDLDAVVEVIEMPYQAQVEIAWACLALARQIADDGYKIVLSGEGSDELFASYAFAYHGLKKDGDWTGYRKGLILSQARKNFARCNKVFMRYGVECRLPFVDRDVVEFCLALPRVAVKGADGRGEKLVLREAFANQMPEEVRQAKKLAFQQGLGLIDALDGYERRTRYERVYQRTC
jgi:asparagine synthase (glutamine-hydrolysing)